MGPVGSPAAHTEVGAMHARRSQTAIGRPVTVVVVVGMAHWSRICGRAVTLEAFAHKCQPMKQEEHKEVLL